MADFAPYHGDGSTTHVPVRAFATAAAAHSEADRLTAEVRTAYTPVQFLAFTRREFPTERMAALCATVGLAPPEFPGDDYWVCEEFQRWWLEHRSRLTPEFERSVWELFADRIPLYRVVERPLED